MHIPEPKICTDPTSYFPALAERRPPLGEWLVRRGLISRSQLFSALAVHYQHRCRIGDAVVWLEHLSRVRLEEETAMLMASDSERSISTDNPLG